MKGLIKVFFACVIVVSTSGCFHRMAPSSNAGKYNTADDVTVYEVTPYGAIKIPGKWDAGKYAKSSKQQYFYRADTSTLVAAIAPCSSLPFNKGNAEGFDVVKKYYDMELQYQSVLQEQKPEVIVDDSEKRYMIWMTHIDGIDQYFLCGVKDCTCNECTYRTLNLKTRKMNADESVKFLQNIFLSE